MKLYAFNAIDQERLRLIASQRNDKPESCNRKFSDQDNEAIHYRGVLAEAAFSRHFQVPMNTRRLWRGDKHAPDLIIQGYGAQVKSARIMPSILKLNDMSEFDRSDIAMLAYVQEAEGFVYLGWYIHRDDFARSYYVRDFGNGPRLCMDACRMIKVQGNCLEIPMQRSA